MGEINQGFDILDEKRPQSKFEKNNRENLKYRNNQENKKIQDNITEGGTLPNLRICEVKLNLENEDHEDHKNKADDINILGGKEKETACSISEIEPPDGGWAWVVAIGTCIVGILIPMPLAVYSIIYSEVLMKGEVSTKVTASIFNAALFISTISGVFVPTLCTMIGYRKVSIMGAFLCGLGIILSAFVTSSPFYLFICYSVLYGLGCGMCMPVRSFIIPQYFEKRRGLILGLTEICKSTSFFLAPLLVGILHSIYAYKGSALILGALIMNGCPAGALYHPVEWHVNNKNKETLKPKESLDSVEVENGKISKEPPTQKNMNRMLNSASNIKTAIKSFLTKFAKQIMVIKSHRVKIITLSYSIIAALHMNTIMLIPFLLKQRGHSLEVSLQLLSLLNIVNFAARVLISIIIDRLPVNSKYYYLFGAFCLPIATFGFSLVTNMTLFSVAACLYGFGHGCCIVVTTLIIIDIMGMEHLLSTYSALILITGILNLIFGPLIGIIRDLSGSYGFTLQIMSLMFTISFIVCLLMPMAKLSDKKRGCAQPSLKAKQDDK